ncbi:zinc finger BED domain-containing protein RICESLEEPER 2-like [Nicotiana tabacum]|uniref:Zinc finger BED domain-containing protein RICESLEEPER 2-like n=1 Tax=Nicotiana tabacum TaxID=4097 RepID=A0AC58TXA9_TOBAC
MLSRAVKFESAFSHHASREIGLRHYLQDSYIEDGIPMSELLSSDWKNIKRINRFLEIFYLRTLKISGSRYVTSNIHFLKICVVASYLKQLIENKDIVLSEIAINMKEKFDKYWGDPGKINKIIFISCILDPRYKLELVGYALVKMFGDSRGATIQAEVKKYMNSLFNEYVRSNSKGVALASSSTCYSLDTSTSELSGSQWKMNSARFSVLAETARDILAIPISSVASECALSTGQHLLDSFRSSLTPKLVQALVQTAFVLVQLVLSLFQYELSVLLQLEG